MERASPRPEDPQRPHPGVEEGLTWSLQPPAGLVLARDWGHLDACPRRRRASPPTAPVATGADLPGRVDARLRCVLWSSIRMRKPGPRFLAAPLGALDHGSSATVCPHLALPR